MFRRLQEMRKRDEAGFTLIELLVVILIIAILAAIAIPVFLKQREKGYVAQVQSALKNASTAEESYLTGSTPTSYTNAPGDLVTEGYKAAPDVTALTITISAGKKYCVQAGHSSLSATYVVSSDDSVPTVGTCAAGGVKA